MNDSNTTFKTLTDEVIKLCIAKGWGKNGLQNPQHVTSAMIVETLEMLEHFEACDDSLFDDENEKTETLEEIADMLNYMMQAMRVLKVDFVNLIDGSFNIVKTNIEELRLYAGIPNRLLYSQAMVTAIKARFALEEMQWLNDDDVIALSEGRSPEKALIIGEKYAQMLLEILRLINMLGGDVSKAVRRKLDIVYKRKPKAFEPVR